ncbi:hypothetical protein [Roseovarius confluentis]
MPFLEAREGDGLASTLHKHLQHKLETLRAKTVRARLALRVLIKYI